jgi:hypothetical protein
MESITDWAFSWPISVDGFVRREFLGSFLGGGLWRGVGRTLVVVYDVAQVVTASVMGLAHAHGVVGEVDIAVVAWRIRIRFMQAKLRSFAQRTVGAYKKLIRS